MLFALRHNSNNAPNTASHTTLLHPSSSSEQQPANSCVYFGSCCAPRSAKVRLSVGSSALPLSQRLAPAHARRERCSVGAGCTAKNSCDAGALLTLLPEVARFVCRLLVTTRPPAASSSSAQAPPPPPPPCCSAGSRWRGVHAAPFACASPPSSEVAQVTDLALLVEVTNEVYNACPSASCFFRSVSSSFVFLTTFRSGSILWCF